MTQDFQAEPPQAPRPHLHDEDQGAPELRKAKTALPGWAWALIAVAVLGLFLVGAIVVAGVASWFLMAR